MRCPTLKELPPCPENKTGWPWTEETPQPLPFLSKGKSWPRISIVTPSYNQVNFIEETIRSVLLQGYPDLEYIIIDGGSSDGSVEIIKKYSQWLTFWVSEKDEGHPDGVNKGMRIAGGQILGYLNSDDLLTKRSLFLVSKLMLNYKTDWLSGRCMTVDEKESELSINKPNICMGSIGWIAGLCHLPQPATFWTVKAAKKTGEFDKRLAYLDYDYFVRLSLAGYKPFLTKYILAKEHDHADRIQVRIKNTDEYYRCVKIMREKFADFLSEEDKKQLSRFHKIQKDIDEIKFNMKHGFFRLLSLSSVIRLGIKYPNLFFDRRLYGCTKFILLPKDEK